MIHDIIAAYYMTGICYKWNALVFVLHTPHTKYNDIFEETWNQIPQKNQNYQHLEQTIINAMEKSTGKITINNNKKNKKTTNEEIKNAKSIRKKHKQKFREACQNNNIEEIIKTKKDYIESQTKTRSEVEK